MKFYKGQHCEADGIEQVVFRETDCDGGKGMVDSLALRVEALAKLAVMAGFLSDEQQQADLAASFGWRTEKVSEAKAPKAPHTFPQRVLTKDVT